MSRSPNLQSRRLLRQLFHQLYVILAIQRIVSPKVLFCDLGTSISCEASNTMLLEAVDQLSAQTKTAWYYLAWEAMRGVVTVRNHS